MKNKTQIEKAKFWVSLAGWVNAVLALPFGLPFINNIYTQGWIKLNDFLGGGGTEWSYPDDAAGMMFMVLAGLGLHLVGITLIYASRNLSVRMGVALLNGIVRVVFVFVGLYILIKWNGPRIMYFFVLIDVILGPVLIWVCVGLRKYTSPSDRDSGFRS